jgi:hypothetical protein
LFRQSGHHSFRRLRFVSDQIHGGNDQRQIVVDVVTHHGELLVQLPKLFYGQCDWLTRQSHLQRWSKTIPQIKSAADNGATDEMEGQRHSPLSLTPSFLPRLKNRGFPPVNSSVLISVHPWFHFRSINHQLSTLNAIHFPVEVDGFWRHMHALEPFLELQACQRPHARYRDIRLPWFPGSADIQIRSVQREPL